MPSVTILPGSLLLIQIRSHLQNDGHEIVSKKIMKPLDIVSHKECGQELEMLTLENRYKWSTQVPTYHLQEISTYCASHSSSVKWELQ